jgi:2-oxoglutarate/2-oxoacid ferredoxin oxidoreductase subunit alpha
VSRRFLEGSEAMAESAVRAGCRFFAGYPMTPFTGLLEHLSTKLPAVGGACINAESEIEAVNMVWGALAAGARAATGSVGQGLSLMQEALSELAMAELPLVAFNMARGQSDYFQSTRGGGHGDYRHIVLAPMSVSEAVRHVGLAFELADRWANPVLVLGDYVLAHTWATVDLPEPADLAIRRPFGVDGGAGGTGRSRMVSYLPLQKANAEPTTFEELYASRARKLADIAAREPRLDSEDTEDADVVVGAFGTLAYAARHAVRTLRQAGRRLGWARPVTLWPFPDEALREACRHADEVIVIENNAGQMLDDVRLSLGGAVSVRFAGGISQDADGFGVGRLNHAAEVERRLAAALDANEVIA